MSPTVNMNQSENHNTGVFNMTTSANFPQNFVVFAFMELQIYWNQYTFFNH